MRPSRVIAGLVSAALLVAGIALWAARTRPPTPPPLADPVRAADDYVKYCAACHGVDGRTVAGSIAPNLASDDLLTLASDAFLRAAIAEGRPGRQALGAKGVKMMAYAASASGPLDDERIDDLVAHVRRWQTAPSVALDDGYRAAGDAAAGAAVYARECASCHGADGWGDGAPRLAGEVFQASASDDFIRQTLRRGRRGTAMRSYDLAPADEDALIAFIRTFDPTPPR